MANIKSYPNNIDEYIGAEEVMRWHHGRTSGVYGSDGSAGTNCAVAAVATQMAVTVEDGYGWLTDDSGNGIAWWNDYAAQHSGTKLQLTLSPTESTGLLGRIDRIIVRWTIGLYDSVPQIVVLEGTSAASPTAKALTNNSSIREISLAKITIPAATTAITSAMITDERLDSSVCGLVTESITADTSVAQQQFSGLLYSVQQRLAQLEASSAVELKKYTYSNQVVLTSAWTTDSTREDYNADYPYRANIQLNDITGSEYPQITFSLADTIEGIFAPIAATYLGGIYIYASEIPSAAITIPTIVCWRA